MRHYSLKHDKIVQEGQFLKTVEQLKELREKAINETSDDEGLTVDMTFIPSNERVIRAFDNGKFRIELEWVGVVPDDHIQNRFASDFEIYRVTITDYLDGKLRDKPSESNSFNKYGKAMFKFEDTIISFTSDAFYDEDGDFQIEEGKNRMIEHALPLLFDQQEEGEKAKPKLKEVKPQTSLDADSELFGW